MKIVVFGLSISSSWGNGHATLWRALCAALDRLGHRVVFFEKDVPYYASNRDVTSTRGCEIRLYGTWDDAAGEASAELADAGAAMVTSYCPDGPAACDFVLQSAAGVKCFYDLDTPITLENLDTGKPVSYLPAYGLAPFDLVLSYTGGEALRALRDRLGARRVAPLYGSVDPSIHQPAASSPEFAADLSYLGTYAEDRQQTLETLFLDAARRRPSARFVIGGAQYPMSFPWTDNIFFVRHLPPAQHPTFYCSSRMTLNITRRAMASMGYCPSGRLFEAAACGVPILSDWWEGFDSFYTPGKEVLVCRSTGDVLAALDTPEEQLARIAAAARARTLAEHTADARAQELIALLNGAMRDRSTPQIAQNGDACSLQA